MRSAEFKLQARFFEEQILSTFVNLRDAGMDIYRVPLVCESPSALQLRPNCVLLRFRAVG